jgi:drug/metabolite transporter (DMT)-like permease
MTIVGSAFVSAFFMRSMTMVFLIIFFLFTNRIKLLSQIKKYWPVMFIVALLVFTFDLLANIGFKNYDVSTGSVLLRSEIIFVFIISTLILKEKIKWYEWLFVTAMFIGVVLAIDINYATVKLNLWSLLFIGSGLIMAISAFLTKYMQKKYNLNIYVIVFFNNVIALISFAIIAFATGDIFSIGGGVEIKLGLLFIYFILGTMSQIGQMFTYYMSIEKLPIWKTKSYCLLVPVICTILSIYIFNEKHSALSYVGIGIVIFFSFVLILANEYKIKYHEIHTK